MNLLRGTSEYWKHQVGQTVFWLGGVPLLAGILLFDRLGSTTASAAIAAGATLSAIGFTWKCLMVRCPTCELRLYWHAVSSGAAGRAILSYREMRECPQCGFRGE